MHIRRISVVGVLFAIVFVCGIGVKLAYNRNELVEQVRVYELPNARESDSETFDAQPTQVYTATATRSQQGDDTEDNTELLASSASDVFNIEPCCPEEVDTAPLDDTAFSQAPVVDHIPVPSAVIEDGRLHAEYWDAHLRHHDQVVASKEAMDALLPELNAFVEDNRSPEQIRRNMADPAYRAKAAALLTKLEALEERDRQLVNQLPMESSYVH